MPRLVYAFLVTLFVASLGNARSISGQSICRPADANSATLIAYLGRFSSATSGGDSASRVALKLPVVPADQLALVTQEATCRKGLTAFEDAVAAQGGSGLSGRVYVVKIGTVYAVLDPDYHWGPDPGYWNVVIVDSKFKRLSAFTTDT